MICLYKGGVMQIKRIINSIEKNQITAFHLARLTNRQAVQLFEYLKWRCNNGKPFCPECGNPKKIYKISANGRYRCGEIQCGHTFSVFTKTLLHNHSLQNDGESLAKILYAIALMATDITLADIATLSGLSYQTVFVYFHRLLSTFDIYNRDGEKFNGVVEMDGIHMNRYNTKHKKRGVVIIYLRQRGGNGANRTLAFVGKNENASLVEFIAKNHIEKGTEIQTDGHWAYSHLSSNDYVHKYVNHKKEYVSADGVNNNQCESINSRTRLSIDKMRRGVKQENLQRYSNRLAHYADTIDACKIKGLNKQEIISLMTIEYLIRFVTYEAPSDLTKYGVVKRARK